MNSTDYTPFFPSQVKWLLFFWGGFCTRKRSWKLLMCLTRDLLVKASPKKKRSQSDTERIKLVWLDVIGPKIESVEFIQNHPESMVLVVTSTVSTYICPNHPLCFPKPLDDLDSGKKSGRICKVNCCWSMVAGWPVGGWAGWLVWSLLCDNYFLANEGFSRIGLTWLDHQPLPAIDPRQSLTHVTVAVSQKSRLISRFSHFSNWTANTSEHQRLTSPPPSATHLPPSHQLGCSRYLTLNVSPNIRRL